MSFDRIGRSRTSGQTAAVFQILFQIPHHCKSNSKVIITWFVYEMVQHVLNGRLTMEVSLPLMRAFQAYIDCLHVSQ